MQLALSDRAIQRSFASRAELAVEQPARLCSATEPFAEQVLSLGRGPARRRRADPDEAEGASASLRFADATCGLVAARKEVESLGCLGLREIVNNST